jgi:glyoxylate reductase
MALPRVFVTRAIPEAGLQLLQGQCDYEVWSSPQPPSYEKLCRLVAGCHGILSLLTDRIDGPLMDRAGAQLKVVSNMAVGYDNIDLAAARKRGVAIGNTPGVLTETTADLAFALMASAARRIVEGVDYIRGGSWQTWGPKVLLGHDLHGATLGIVGFGRIGCAMARRGKGFRMRILFADPKENPSGAAGLGAERRSLTDLLGEADFVSLHAPSTEKTHHLIGSSELGAMKNTAILVNTARGELVDPAALEVALKQGEIAYAALDVTDPEPLAPSHPLMNLPNCVVVPHIGSASHATRNLMAVMAVHNLLAGIEGRPLPDSAL